MVGWLVKARAKWLDQLEKVCQWGGLFDYSVTPGPGLVKSQMSGAWLGRARAKARAKELDNSQSQPNFVYLP